MDQGPKRLFRSPEHEARFRAKQRQHILSGLSDDEFEQRYDPDGYFQRRLLHLLEDIHYALLDRRPDQVTKEQPWYPARPSRAIHPPTGAIEV